MAVELGWPSTEYRFRAMGTDCHVIVVGPAGQEHLVFARERIDTLERLWSRFLPSSEVSRLASSPEGLIVSEATFSLIEHAVLAWELTGGRFDPTMSSQLSSLGYDRSFEQLAPPSANGERIKGQPSAGVGCASIVLDRSKLKVKLPPGVGFDPGGMGKGFAADLVSQELVARGAWGVLVNLGGDLRVRGTPAVGEAWVITVCEPTVCREPIATLRLDDCGMATSTTTKRRWLTGGQDHHHLLDPATGLPHQTPVDLVTVVAGDGWWAEAAATAMIGDPQQSAPRSGRTPQGCAALRVLSDGTVQRLADFERYEA